MKAKYTKTSNSLKVKAVRELDVTFAICWACLLFHREAILIESVEGYPFEEVANDIVRKYWGQQYSASEAFVNLVATVRMPTTNIEEVVEIFESGAYLDLKSEIGNPMRKNSNARRGHLY